MKDKFKHTWKKKKIYIETQRQTKKKIKKKQKNQKTKNQKNTYPSTTHLHFTFKFSNEHKIYLTFK